MAGEGTERIAIEGNILDRLESLEALVQSILNGDVVTSDGSNVAQSLSNVLQEFIAQTYPAEDFHEWRTDDTNELIAKLAASYDIPFPTLAAGLEIMGWAKNSGDQGIIMLEVGDENESIFSAMSLRSTHLLNIDLGGGSEYSAKGVQKVDIFAYTTETDEPNDVLYLSTRTNGTALAGLGTFIHLAIEDSAGNTQQAGSMGLAWLNPTDGAETAIPKMFVTENGTLTEYQLLNPRSLGADNLRTSISTAGETTVFSTDVPANFFAAAGSIFQAKTRAFIDTNASARVLTIRLKLNGNTICTYTVNNGGNTVTDYYVDAWVSRGAEDVQDCWLNVKRWNETSSDAPSTTQDAPHGAGAENDAAAITISMTMQLAGSVDAGYFGGYDTFGIGDE
jgi:hypothetical protein